MTPAGRAGYCVVSSILGVTVINREPYAVTVQAPKLPADER